MPKRRDSSDEDANDLAARELGRITEGFKSEVEKSRESYEEASGANALFEYNNVKYMCPELDSLDMTWRQQELGQLGTLQSMVMERIKDPSFDIDHLAMWASRVIKELGAKKADKRAFDGLDLDFLQFIGLGRLTYSTWKGAQLILL